MRQPTMARRTPMHVSQTSLPGMCPVEDALEEFSISGVEERGAIFTKREVVEFILDLAGYDAVFVQTSKPRRWRHPDRRRRRS